MERRSIQDWMTSRSLWQVGLSYVLSSWVVLEVTATIGEVAGLPLWISRLVLALLVLGLFVVLATAVVQRGVQLPHESGTMRARLGRVLTWRAVFAGGVATFALLGVGATVSFAIDRFGPLTADAGGRRGVRWATDVALPRILALTEEGRLLEAYGLAVDAERHIPESPMLRSALTDVSRYTSVRTNPPGATVELRPYSGSGEEWTVLGATPLDAVRIPVGFFRWRITMPGHRTVEMSSSGLQFPRLAAHDGLPLGRVEDEPEEMVPVPGRAVSLGIPDLFDRPAVALGPHLLDRHVVTNRAYAAVVEAGGYRDPTFWTEPFVRDGRSVGFEDAVAELVDRTGLPGPSTWTGGDYPDGADEQPVTGISWYEAAAYARFAGKELPTIYHWHRAAGSEMAIHLIPESNYSGEGLAPVGSYEGVGPFGTYDMAGNAKEWVRNATGGLRYVLGGAWDEPSYLFREAEARSAWDRSANHGARLMVSTEPVPLAALADMPPPSEAGTTAVVSDEVWAAYAALYEYDRGPLDAVVEDAERADDWVRERVSYRAAYGEERIPALLFLPRKVEPPYQAVVAFPGSSALLGGRVEGSAHPTVEYLVRSGRAVILPVYRGTYERATGLADDNPDTSAGYRDHVVSWSKDLGRSIDYLESRSDIDATRIAYYGVSWGAGIGVVLAAVEPRLDAVILDAGGFWNTPTRPEVDQRVFAPRVTVPALLLGGRFDTFFPLQASQLPMYHALGTPEPDKRHVVYDSGHAVPLLQAVREMYDWLDLRLGPVR